MPDYIKYFTLVELEDNFKIAFRGEGFYTSGDDTLLIVSHGPQRIDEDHIYKCMVYHSPENTVRNMLRELADLEKMS